MRYRITAANELIGYSSFEGVDPPMGVAMGAFTPTLAYKRVRHVFRSFVDAEIDNDRAKFQAYFAARDRLDLGVETEDGSEISVETVHILDYSEELGEYEIMIQTDEIERFEQ
jgi:hypothetical protein